MSASGLGRYVALVAEPPLRRSRPAPPNHPGYGKVMAIDTQALGELEVQDATGATVRVGSAWAKGPAVLVFLRHFG